MPRQRDNFSGWAFIAFPVAIITVFTTLPTLIGIALSFCEWSGGGTPHFVGIQNYQQALHDPVLWRALRNALIFAIVSVPLTIALAFPLAAAVNARWFVGRTLMRTVYFLPTVISIVAIGLLWRWLLTKNDGGLLNYALTAVINIPHALHLTADAPHVNWPNWLGNSPWGMATLIVVSTWRGLGFAVVLYLAALSNVPQAHYDAAAVDGAGAWQTLRHVAWPAVRPMTVFLLVTGLIGALQVFDIVYVMIGNSNQESTDVLNTYLYREFSSSRLGYAATIGVVVLTATALVTVLQVGWIRRSAEGVE